MKFVFLVNRVKGELCVVAIRRQSSSDWFHFRRIHWPIDEHNWHVKQQVVRTGIAYHRQVTVNLTEPESVLEYFDAIREVFVFKSADLEKGKFLADKTQIVQIAKRFLPTEFDPDPVTRRTSQVRKSPEVEGKKRLNFLFLNDN